MRSLAAFCDRYLAHRTHCLRRSGTGVIVLYPMVFKTVGLRPSIADLASVPFHDWSDPQPKTRPLEQWLSIGCLGQISNETLQVASATLG